MSHDCILTLTGMLISIYASWRTYFSILEGETSILSVRSWLKRVTRLAGSERDTHACNPRISSYKRLGSIMKRSYQSM